MLSFGDPLPFTGLIRESGAVLIIGVTDMDEARQAVDLGADIIVDQGTEGGGPGGGGPRSSRWPAEYPARTSVTRSSISGADGKTS